MPTIAGSNGYMASFEASAVDEGEPKSMVAELHVRSYADVVLQPDVLTHDFSNKDGASARLSFVVTRFGRGDKPEKVKPALIQLPPMVQVVAAQPRGAAAEIEPKIWRQSWNIDLAVRPDESLASVAAPHAILVRLAGPTGRTLAEVALPVLLRRVFGIEAPREVHMGIVPPGETRKKRLLVRASDGRPFKIARIRADSCAFEGSEIASRVASSHWLEAVFSSKYAGDNRSRLVIETDHPDAPTVTVELFASVGEFAR